MRNYPKINWWLGNLYPHESIVSFVSRFCCLNYIRVSQLNDYLEINLNNRFTSFFVISDDDNVRISEKLGDDINVVKTVFSRIENGISNFIYRPPIEKQHRYLRYCESCLSIGYHSGLHELGWIVKCPLHLCELKIINADSHGTILESQAVALEKLMRENCSLWPCNSEDLCFITQRHKIYSVERWVRGVNDAAIAFGSRMLWSSNPGMAYRIPLSQTIGQLRVLKNPSKHIEDVLYINQEKWSLNIKRFPKNIRDELLKNNTSFTLEDIFNFYKYVAAHSYSKAPFSKKLQAAQDIINARHDVCECEWILMNEGWYSNWVWMNPRERPYSGIRCPYEDAIHELELGWGRHDVALSRQKYVDSIFKNYQLAIKIEHLGLFRWYTDPSYIYHNRIEWNEYSPLSELFNTMAECEVLEHLRNMENWLDSIERGGNPGIAEWNTHCVQLFLNDEGLTLVNWTAEPIYDSTWEVQR